MNKTHLPQGWKLVTLGEISKNFISGGTPSTLDSSFWEGNIPWVRSAWLRGKYVEKGERTITPEGLDNSSSNIVPKDNLLIATRVSLGNIAINKVDVAINQDLTGVILDKSKASEEFVYFSFIHDPTKIISQAQGSTIQGITRRQLETILILLPPIGQQQKIISILSNVDSLIQQTQKIIEQTQKLKKGFMQKLLTKGIGHTKFKKIKWLFGNEIDIPIEWEQHKLKNLVHKLGDGIHSTPNYVDDSDFYFINGNNLINGSIVFFDNTKNVDENEYKKYKLELNENTVLLSINGTIGNISFYNDEKIILGKSVCYIICNSKLNKKFLFYLLQSNYLNKYFRRELTGTTISNLSLASIKNSPILLPTIEEQQEIASILSNIDSTIQKQQEYQSILEFVKKGLMQKLLTGQIRVKV